MRHVPQKTLPLIFLLTVTCTALLAPRGAQAETRREYVNQYVLIIDWITRAETWVNRRLNDPGLCRLAHSIAEHHVEEARRMTPPQEFVAIHPHLLLVLENAERMFHFAATGDRQGYRRHQRRVHEEQRIIAELLQTEGMIMPIIEP